MKLENKPYSIRPSEEFPFTTLNEGADELGITPQRMSRLLKILEIGIHRRGHTLFLGADALERVKKAIDEGEIKPGRKRKNETL